MSDRQIPTKPPPPRQCRHCTQQATTLVYQEPLTAARGVQYAKQWVCDTHAVGRREAWRG